MKEKQLVIRSSGSISPGEREQPGIGYHGDTTTRKNLLRRARGPRGLRASTTINTSVSSSSARTPHRLESLFATRRIPSTAWAGAGRSGKDGGTRCRPAAAAPPSPDSSKTASRDPSFSLSASPAGGLRRSAAKRVVVLRSAVRCGPILAGGHHAANSENSTPWNAAVPTHSPRPDPVWHPPVCFGSLHRRRPSMRCSTFLFFPALADRPLDFSTGLPQGSSSATAESRPNWRSPDSERPFASG
mmetsp:Transcript_9262/g.22757  ORF Transcript_9262/g.22757 Transcript_9262/m.22757 type:complete len:244 (+) Transcript_9262:156-887(+)